ncbi:MAG: PAS domain-containing protein [bacterium]
MAMFFPYFELAAALFTLLFAFSIMSRHYEDRTARFFARFALIAFFAGILEYSVRIAFTLEIAAAINRLSGVFWALLFPVFLHFSLIFCKREDKLKQPLALPVIYGPAILIAVLFLMGDVMFLRHEIHNFGITTQPSVFYWLFVLESLVYSAFSFLVLYNYAKQTIQPAVKAQAQLIAYGVLVPSLVGLVNDEIMPLIIGHRVFPPICVLLLAVMNGFIFWAVRKHSLFSISPALAAETIIETMPDSLIVTDQIGRIIFLNEEAQKFFHVPASEISGHSIKDLFKNVDDYYKLYNEVAKKGLIIECFKAEMINPHGESISSVINARLLRDKLLGENIGLVFVVRDIRG